LTVKVNRIIDDGMNMKEILKEGWDVYPKWLWAGNIFCLVLALLVILFI